MSFRPLTYKKVYVNSKYRVSGSKSTSDFKIELQNTFEIPDDTVMYIHEVSIPNTWYSINSTNNNIYVSQQDASPDTPSGFNIRRVEIPITRLPS